MPEESPEPVELVEESPEPVVEAAQVEPAAAEEPKTAPATTSGSSSRGLSATELHAELASLGMDMKGTKLKEALAILREWHRWVIMKCTNISRFMECNNIFS